MRLLKTFALLTFFLGLAGVGAGQVTITNLAVTGMTPTSATISWTTSGPANTQVLFGIGGVLNSFTPANANLVTNHSATITGIGGLPPYTIFSYAAVSVDGSAHRTQSATQQFELCTVANQGLVQTSGTINNYYEYGTYSLTWQNNSGQILSPTVCGSPILTVITGNLDGLSSFSNQVPDSLQVVPSPSQWTLSATSVGGIGTFTLAPITITGPSFNLSAPLVAGATGHTIHVWYDQATATFYPPIPGGGGGGGVMAILGTPNQITATTSGSGPTLTSTLSFPQQVNFPGVVNGPGPFTVTNGVANSIITLLGDPACGQTVPGMDQVCPLITAWGDQLSFNNGISLTVMPPGCPIFTTPTAGQLLGWNTTLNCYLGTPLPGSSGQIFFNGGNTISASSSLSWNNTTNTLTLPILNVTTLNLTNPIGPASGGTGSTTVPGSGQLAIGNAGGTAYVPTTLSGDGTITSAGVLSVTKTGGVAFGPFATQTAPCTFAQGCTGLASGTSGGILGFTGTTTLASSVALTTSILVKGGGAGATPTNSSISDNGTSIVSSEPVSFGALLSTGLGAGTKQMGQGFPLPPCPTNAPNCIQPFSVFFYSPVVVTASHGYVWPASASASAGALYSAGSSTDLQGNTVELLANQAVTKVVAVTKQKAETGTADTNVLTFTPPATAGTYQACFVASVSSATAGVIGWTLSWTDSNGNAQSNIAISFFQQGTAAPAATFTTSAAGNYQSCSRIDINNAAANIVFKWVGGGTSAAKVSATLEQTI